MTHVTITNEIIQASILVEGTTTKTTRSILNTILVFLDFISNALIPSLGLGEGFRLGGIFLVQKGAMGIDSSGGVFKRVSGGLDGVVGDLLGDLKKKLKEFKTEK